MPTPSDSTTSLQYPSDPHNERSIHTSCPPDPDRSWRDQIVPANEDSISSNEGVEHVQGTTDESQHNTHRHSEIEDPARPLSMEPDLPMDLSASESISPLHLRGAASPPGNAGVKDEEQEAEQSSLPESGRPQTDCVDETTSSHHKFSQARVCTLASYSWRSISMSDTPRLDSVQLDFLFPPAWEQIQRYSAVGSAEL